MLDHGVESLFQLENLSAHVHGDFLGEVAGRDSGGNFGNVSYLAREIAGHEVDVIGKILPRAGDSGYLGLAAQLPFRADFASHARNFTRESVQLVHHGVDGVLQFEDFAFHVDRDLARQVSARNGSGDLSDVSNLSRQVASHGIDGVREIFPGAADSRHLSLAAQFSLGADLAGHASHFARERVQLVHHGIDGVLKFEDFALYVDRNLAGQVSTSNGGGHLRDVADLSRQVAGHRVHGVCEIFPGSSNSGNLRLAAKSTIGADLASHAGDF